MPVFPTQAWARATSFRLPWPHWQCARARRALVANWGKWDRGTTSRPHASACKPKAQPTPLVPDPGCCRRARCNSRSRRRGVGPALFVYGWPRRPRPLPEILKNTQFNLMYVLTVRASCGGGKKAESWRRVSVCFYYVRDSCPPDGRAVGSFK